MLAGEYVWGVLTVEKAIEKLKGYSYTEATISKAVASL
jgi:anti-sigma-K factor RskA